MTTRIDFNSDIGESFGAYTLGSDTEVIRHITSANIACGFHAGDPVWMRRTVELAEQHGVAIGAHPGFPDLRGFGRRNMQVTPEEARDDITYQIGALAAFTTAKRLQHVKPHGAIYNMAVQNDDLAKGICDGVLQADPELVITVLAGSRWVGIARAMGLRVARETFVDRSFNADGTLVSRGKTGAVIHEPTAVIERAIRIATERTVVAATGEVIPIEADTMCLHGDNPEAATLAAALRRAFEAAGIALVPLGALV
ncbi:MAG: 5-oxoprolinase subunit PxpA [Vicinamibacterales bacterium]